MLFNKIEDLLNNTHPNTQFVQVSRDDNPDCQLIGYMECWLCMLNFERIAKANYGDDAKVVDYRINKDNLPTQTIGMEVSLIYKVR